MRSTLFLFLLLLSILSFGQRHPIGTFFSHLPYNQARELAMVDSVVYCHTGPSLFSFDIRAQSIERLNTISGLSDMGVGSIASDEETKTLFIGYENGNFDLIRNNEILNFEDIRRSTVVADKSINHIYVHQGQAYISTGFGLLRFDIEKEEFSATYLVGENESYLFVNSSIIFKDTLYCATVNGVYKAGLESELEDYRSWNKDSGLSNPNARYNHLFLFNDSLFVNQSNDAFRSDTVYVQSGNSWLYYPKLSNETNYNIRSSSSSIALAQSTAAVLYDNNWNQLSLVFDYGSGIPPNPRDVIYDPQSGFWIADFNQGLIKSNDAFNNEVLTPTSPKSANNFNIQSFNSKVLVSAGAVNDNWLNTLNDQ
jgi:hypothetical protein